MKMKNLIVLLAVVSMGICVENLFIKGNQLNEKANDTLIKAITKTAGGKTIARCNQVASTGEKIPLRGANIPLYSGAERLTFDGGNAIRYRIPAEAEEVAEFYSEKLSPACQPADKNAAGESAEKLTIALYEDPISNKTYATFALLPKDDVEVLGIELAQYAEAGDVSDSSQSAPDQSQPTGQTPPPTPQNPTGQPPYPGDFSTPPPPSSEQPYQPNYPVAGPSGQTCRVNGVEMPGPCPAYNNMPPTQQMEYNMPRDEQRMGPGGEQGQREQQGPSEEDMKKMDERRFKDMKRGLEQFSKGVKMMKKSAAKMKGSINKCGVNLPEELENALANSDNVIGKIQSAQTAEELEDVVGDVEDIGSVLQDWGPRMGELQRLCQMLKQADREIKQLDRSVKRAESRDNANKKIDLTEIITNYKQDVEGMRQTLKEVKELAKTDPETAMEKIEDDFFGQMDNVRSNEMAVEMALNVTKGLKDSDQEIKNFEKQISALKKKKIDTGDVEAQLTALKDDIKELKSIIKGKFEAEDLVDMVEGVFEAREQLQDDLHNLTGGTETMPKIKEDKSYNVKVDLPDSFKKQDINEEEQIPMSQEKPMPAQK